jgi:chemotaxis protein methyltransferase CheR
MGKENNVSARTDALLQEVSQLVSSWTGIRLRDEDTRKLGESLRQRMTCLKLTDPANYLQLLTGKTSDGLTEWEQLVSLLINGETYFFRDSGQFTLLKKTVLPELIERRKTVRSLRIWSAGCSTGEEAYSLAILVDQLLPLREDWRVYILGTDVNSQAVQHAQRGIYNQWAFRLVDSGLHQRYFHEKSGQWVLKHNIREMVTFRCVNVFRDIFPSPSVGIYDMDLILCRNVFLYFHRHAIARVVEKMTDTLTFGGYFITGHNELPPETLGQLQTRIFPDSIVYQRAENLQGSTS